MYCAKLPKQILKLHFLQVFIILNHNNVICIIRLSIQSWTYLLYTVCKKKKKSKQSLFNYEQLLVPHKQDSYY